VLLLTNFSRDLAFDIADYALVALDFYFQNAEAVEGHDGFFGLLRTFRLRRVF